MIDNAPAAPGMNRKPQCPPLPAAPTVPPIPDPGTCPGKCTCPEPPAGEPQDCFDTLIAGQNAIVKTAERAALFAAELTAIQDKVTSAQVDYTQARFVDLRKRWKEQDDEIVELIRKLVCAVDCWECLLECRLCKQLAEIRRLETCLDGPPGKDPMGTGPLAEKTYSLYDQQAWHVRNVAQMEARMKRITDVLAAWEKPSTTLGEALDKNADLIRETQNVIASDPAKAVYDVFMTLIPRHWAIRPRGPDLAKEWDSAIDVDAYVKICNCPAPQAPQMGQMGQMAQQANAGGAAGQDQCPPGAPPATCLCDDGLQDICCGPDVGILSLRQRLLGVLPYILDPAQFPAVICCLTKDRLAPASEQLAAAQAALAAASAKIALVKKQIEDKKAAIEATFRAALSNPIECGDYQPKKAPTPPGPGGPGGPQGPDGPKQSGQILT